VDLGFEMDFWQAIRENPVAGSLVKNWAYAVELLFAGEAGLGIFAQ
jgi:hypothetical protein